MGQRGGGGVARMDRLAGATAAGRWTPRGMPHVLAWATAAGPWSKRRSQWGHGNRPRGSGGPKLSRIRARSLDARRRDAGSSHKSSSDALDVEAYPAS